jgi:hypothetical protein
VWLHSTLAQTAPVPLVDRLVELSFSGICLNSKGHEADGQELIERLLQTIPQRPVQSEDGELLSFRLPEKRR